MASLNVLSKVNTQTTEISKAPANIEEQGLYTTVLKEQANGMNFLEWFEGLLQENGQDWLEQQNNCNDSPEMAIPYVNLMHFIGLEQFSEGQQVGKDANLVQIDTQIKSRILDMMSSNAFMVKETEASGMNIPHVLGDLSSKDIELNKYKSYIGNMMVDLSAKIKDSSKENNVSAKNNIEFAESLKATIGIHSADQEANEQDFSEVNSLVTKSSEKLEHFITKSDLAQTAILNKDVIHNQIATYFKKNMHHMKEVKSLEIQLHPAELGKIDISVRLQDGQVHLNLKASELATEASIQNNLPELRQKLEQMGIPCASLEMSFGNKNRDGQNREHQSQQSKIHNENQEEQAIYIETGFNKATPPDSNQLINVMA